MEWNKVISFCKMELIFAFLALLAATSAYPQTQTKIHWENFPIRSMFVDPNLTENSNVLPGSRIVNGYEVSPHEIPYQVWIIFRISPGGGGWGCGGSLITRRFVLTAAHCILWLFGTNRMEFLAHYHGEVCRYLNRSFKNRWIGRGGPIRFPERSQDLILMDFFLRGYVKEIVYEEDLTIPHEVILHYQFAVHLTIERILDKLFHLWAGLAEVYLGVHNISVEESSRLIITSTKLTGHPDYNPTNITNDVGVIDLEQEIELSAYINIVKLPSSADLNKSYEGDNVRVSGWGKTAGDGNSSDVLLAVNSTVLPNAECEAVFSIFEESEICTSGTGGVGICGGDSGGPLVTGDVQIGVVSYGTRDCVSGYPSFFARVTSFLSWIEENSDYIVQ